MRILSVCALLLAAVAVLAGASSGSSNAPLATAPTLLAHDTSGFVHAKPRKARLTKAPKVQTKKTKAKRTLLAAVTHPAFGGASGSTAFSNISGAIGVAQYLEGTNGAYSIFSRTGQLLDQVTSASFWSNLPGPDSAGLCATDGHGEPSVAYDSIADRWVVAEAAYKVDGGGKPSGAYVQCVAVSTSPDATGTWNRYVFQVSTSLYAARATVGVWWDGYYLSFNQTDANGAFNGAGALVVERSKMLTGAAAQARYFDLSGVTPTIGGMLPATVQGASPPTSGDEIYAQLHDDPNSINDRIELWGFHVDWAAPLTGSTFQPLVNLPITGPGVLLDTWFDCAQPGSTNLWTTCIEQLPPGGQPTTQLLEPFAQAYHVTGVDGLPQLVGQLHYSTAGGAKSLALAATVDIAPNTARAGVAWFDLQDTGAGWSIAQRGTQAPADGLSRWLPSAGLDESGNVGLGYARSGTTADPTTAFTVPTDGAFAEQALSASSQPHTADANWGPSTSLTLDPIDGCTFWLASPRILTGSTWGSAINSFSTSTCTSSATQPPTVTADPDWSAPLVREGLTITGSAATFTGTTSVTNQWRLCDSRGMSCVDIAGANGLTHVMTAADAAGDRTLRFEQQGINANGTSYAVSTQSTIVQSIPPTNTARPTISGTAQSGQTLSAANGTWTSSSPVSYTYRWRRCSSGTCANIGGANSSSYTVTDADVGSTLDVIVSATNTGGGTDANAVATGSVAAAPPPASSGGGGGGGGGGSGPPDLVVTAGASNASPGVGELVQVALTVTDKNNQPASSLFVNVALSSGLEYVSSSVDRGSGCAILAAGSLRCSLDWLSSDAPVGHINIAAKVSASGPQSLTAVATSQQGVLTASNSTTSVAFSAATTGTSGIPAGLNGGGTSPTTKTVADRQAPTARALASTGSRGRAAKLRFRIYDNRGVAKALVTVKRGAKVVGRAATGFGPVAFGSTYYVGWKIPKLAPKGTYSFCLVAYDRASNHSKASCANLAVR